MNVSGLSRTIAAITFAVATGAVSDLLSIVGDAVDGEKPGVMGRELIFILGLPKPTISFTPF
jgi:hypothetical protein